MSTSKDFIRRPTYVPPSRNPSTAKFIIVGEQPGKREILDGRPFTGPAGMELEANLHMAGISRSDCYFTNVIKDLDRPLNHYIEYNKKGPILHEEGQAYINHLASELAECKSTTVVALGNVALFALTDRWKITKWRGSVLQSTLLSGKIVIPSLHPATILPPKNQYTNKRLLIWDLLRARRVQEGKWITKDRNIIIRPSYSTCLEFLNACKYYGLLGNTIFYDIEVDVYNKEMTCISFSFSPEDVISIPFICEHGDYFTIPQEMEILTRIAEILEHPDISIGGQNLSFDCHYMLHKYGIVTTNIQDTMVAQKTLMPDYRIGLDFICSLYTDLPYYKDDGKYWLKGVGTFESGWRYNALDSVVCSESLPKQIKALIKQQNYYTYQRKCRSISPYVYMMEKGVKINLTSMQKAYDEIGAEASKVLSQLHEIAGFDLNPNSPKQIGEYFYVDKGLPEYRKKGRRTTNEKALKRIARKGFREASLILKYRRLTKERSTYLDTSKVSSDGRMHCSYNPVGTRYARASSSESIFGKGTNFQNQPHKVLVHFLADSYYVFYGMDLSQAENRIVAYEGKILQMIEAFEKGWDIHALTAQIMMGIFYGSKAPKDVRSLAPIGNGKKTWRDWGKKANHGLNYDLGYRNFSLENEIPEKEGRMIVSIYHRAYPGVRQGFHAYVKRCINKNRTLTNLLGRKTTFAGRLDDSLYKDAYSCIPQGTVGDIIDERGLNYIYYNSNPLFKYVELLIQVHDQIGFQIPTPYHPTHPYSWEQHSEILSKIKASLETPLFTHYKKKFVIPVDTTMSITLNKETGVDLESFSPEELEKSYKTLNQVPMLIGA